MAARLTTGATPPRHNGGKAPGISWLDGKHWADVTREERVFCAELYFRVRGDAGVFVAHLNRHHGVELPLEANWEVAYEVCFYRDLHRFRTKHNELSPKRTFDVVLFSDDHIVIFEAKAQQGFTEQQLESIRHDAERVRRLTRVRTVLVGGIVSGRYSPKQSTQNVFDGLIVTWSELATLYDEDIFRRADEVFRR